VREHLKTQANCSHHQYHALKMLPIIGTRDHLVALVPGGA
jgi:hypothetical protein